MPGPRGPNLRYIVDDVESSLSFYRDNLGFEVDLHPAPGFAIVSRQDVRLGLNAATGPGGAAQAMPDGSKPEPGGWNRMVIVVEELAPVVERLREAGVTFRGDVITGRGGKQVLIQDPSGNPIELFEPRAEPSGS